MRCELRHVATGASGRALAAGIRGINCGALFRVRFMWSISRMCALNCSTRVSCTAIRWRLPYSAASFTLMYLILTVVYSSVSFRFLVCF
jgi:hypothetical protein